MKKCLICVVSLLLLVGFSGSVLAVDDNGGVPGDNRVAGYDIASADVIVYPPDAGIEEYMKVGLKMEGGSGLPGLVIFEFDVDNDTATGGGNSMTGIFKTCAPVAPPDQRLKDEKGFDISIMLFLREQAGNLSTGWCASLTCMTRGQTCGGVCTEGCWTPGVSCNPGDANCYILGEPGGQQCSNGSPQNCRNCVGGANDGSLCANDGDCASPGECSSCYKMDTPCSDVDCEEDCGLGRIIGEWYVTAQASGAGGGPPTARGRVDVPLPQGTDSAGEDCYTFPWRRIVEAAYADTTGNPKQFDLDAAKDPANLKWQISVWTDPTDYATYQDDFGFGTQTCAHASDVIPNSGSGKADAEPPQDKCKGDFNEDGMVTGAELGQFAVDFGRQNCPACQ